MDGERRDDLRIGKFVLQHFPSQIIPAVLISSKTHYLNNHLSKTVNPYFFTQKKI